MANDLQISFESLITFFNTPDKSLFASQMKEIEAAFKTSFKCISGDLSLCLPDQLFCMQWGSNKIFENLPMDIFSNKIKSITEWDTFNVLKGLNPDFYAIIGQPKSVDECENILTSESQEGVYSLFNLLSMAKRSA